LAEIYAKSKALVATAEHFSVMTRQLQAVIEEKLSGKTAEPQPPELDDAHVQELVEEENRHRKADAAAKAKRRRPVAGARRNI
jgi:hypothetical protein